MVASPNTSQEINEIECLEKVLFEGLRLWVYNHRAKGKGARQRREAAESFWKALKGYQESVGVVEFEHLYPMVSEEIEGLLLYER